MRTKVKRFLRRIGLIRPNEYRRICARCGNEWFVPHNRAQLAPVFVKPRCPKCGSAQLEQAPVWND